MVLRQAVRPGTAGPGARGGVLCQRCRDYDGLHAATTLSGAVELEAGLPRIEIRCLNNAADALLRLEWEGPELSRRLVPDEALRQP